MNAPTSSVSITFNDPNAGRRWGLVAVATALVLVYLPTYHSLDLHIWNVVGQGHGPVMLALSLWLFWQRFPKLPHDGVTPATVTGTVMLLLGSAAYMVGRSQDLLFLDAGSQIPVAMGVVLLIWGFRGLKTLWFPIFFLIFLIPVPGSIVDSVTAPMKMAVSYAAEQLIYWMGYPIARSGVTLDIGPYKLLVADACAGLNSIFSLEAVGVFYLSIVRHTNRFRNIGLTMLIIPISFVSNVLRVIALVLITYYFGDEVGQGFVHSFAGILLFMVATALTIGTDSLLGIFFKDKNQAAKTLEPVVAAS